MFYTFLTNNISICTENTLFANNVHTNEAGLIDKTCYQCTSRIAILRNMAIRLLKLTGEIIVIQK